MVFSEKGILYTVATLGIIIVANMFGGKIREAVYPNNEDELIRKYLLNESPLYGYNRPKLWIHSTYEYNARKWKSFGSRSSTDLNQPYIHLTIQSIIQHCGDDFNICLIDDDSFSQLIPGWKENVSEMAEPARTYFRELGMCELLYIYGGFIVPNTFICLKNLAPIYLGGIEKDRPFVCETPNHYASIIQNQEHNAFTSNHKFMGAPKRSPVIHDMIEYIKERNCKANLSAEPEFFGYISRWLNNECKRNHINKVDGIYIGVKTKNGKPVSIENLLGEESIPFCSERTSGIYLPGDELLKRCAYKWFAVLPIHEILSSNMIVTKYLTASLQEIPKAEKPVVSKTVVSI
jgi:hypothetical protein